jgi:hypothetical protein
MTKADEVQAILNHVKAPYNQPFNLGAGIKCKSKSRAWFQVGKNNNGRKKSK